MEDNNWSIVIYIIVGIISLVGGIYKNANNKKEEEMERQRRKQANVPTTSDDLNPDYHNESDSLDPFEEFIRRQLGQVEEKPVPQLPTKPDIIKTTPKITLQPQIEGEAVFETTKAALISNSISNNNLAQDIHINTMEEYDYNQIAKDEICEQSEVLFDFDPRKAVIYYEILNRKEF